MQDGEQPSEEASGQQMEEDGLAVGEVTVSIMCPLTRTAFEDPVTRLVPLLDHVSIHQPYSTMCKHSYSRRAILDLLRKNKDQKCPITGALRSMCDKPQ